MTVRAHLTVRALLTGVIIVLLGTQIGGEAFTEGLRRIGPTQITLAIGVGLLTTSCCAARWCLIARGTGLHLRFGTAVAEYYRALLLNAVLPAGVLGDADRGVRHGRASGDVARGVRAVVYERAAGQVALLLLGAVILLSHPTLRRTFEELVIRNAAAALVLGLVLIAVVLVVAGTAKVRALGTEIRLFLAGRGAVPAALALSVVAVSGHLLVFVVAARTVNDAAPLADLIPIAVLALVAMSLPLNVGGWGPREAASAGGFAAAGLGASHGVAAAVVFGVLVLLASAPGLVVLAAHAIGERPGLRPAIPRDEREQQQQDGGHDRATGRAHGELGDDRADHHADQAHRRQPAQDRDEQPDGSRELDDAGRVPEPVAETDAVERLGDVCVTTQHR